MHYEGYTYYKQGSLENIIGSWELTKRNYAQSKYYLYLCRNGVFMNINHKGEKGITAKIGSCTRNCIALCIFSTVHMPL